MNAEICVRSYNLGGVSLYEESWDVDRQRWARVVATMRVLSEDSQCEVISRDASLVMHVVTGCDASLYSDWNFALDLAEVNPEGTPHFIYGPVSDGHFEGLLDGWTVVPAGGLRLAAWIPNDDRGSE